MRTKNLLAVIAGAILLNIGSIPAVWAAKAAAGTDTSGGGFKSYTGELLDFTEAKEGTGKLPFDLNSDTCMMGEIRKIYEKITDPNLKDPIAKLLATKPWYFVNSLAGQKESEQISVLLDNKTKQQIAVQDSEKILVDKKWYDSKGCLERAGLVVHEGFVVAALRWKIDHNNVREMVRTFFADQFGVSFPTNDQITTAYQANGFEVLVYASLFAAQRAKLDSYIQDCVGYEGGRFCTKLKRDIENLDTYSSVMAQLDLLMEKMHTFLPRVYARAIYLDFLYPYFTASSDVKTKLQPAQFLIIRVELNTEDKDGNLKRVYTKEDFKKVTDTQVILYKAALNP